MNNTTYTLTIQNPDGSTKLLRFTDTETHYKVLIQFEGKEATWIDIPQNAFANVAHNALVNGAKILDIEEYTKQI